MFHFSTAGATVAPRNSAKSRGETTMKILVNWDRCEANAVCMRVAPDAFRVDDKDTMQVLVERPEGELLDKVKVAVRRCPKRALSLVDDDGRPVAD